MMICIYTCIMMEHTEHMSVTESKYYITYGMLGIYALSFIIVLIVLYILMRCGFGVFPCYISIYMLSQKIDFPNPFSSMVKFIKFRN